MRRTLLTITLAIGAALWIPTTTAMAAGLPTPEINKAVATSTNNVPAGLTCLHDARAEGCFDPDGDIFYVVDTDSDGASAVLHWQEKPNVQTNPDRDGECISSLGSGVVGECNKNLPENRQVSWYMTAEDLSTGKTVWSDDADVAFATS
jgi:hypothetical protein